MIYWDLFLVFFKIGAVSFGGGYGMISLLQDEVVAHGWLTKEMLMNFIAVAESTPGPIAVNVATFVGSSQAGVLGALLATLGVVLPSFFIILVIAAIMHNLLKFNGVQAVLGGIRPSIVGLVLGTAITMALTALFGFSSIGKGFSFDWRAFVILFLLFALWFGIKKWKKKELSPIVLILLSAVFGIGCYAIPI
ncbi:MAG: chromate transporter [Bacillota bacterium]|nr:MAG: chromate transporter [Bacillota bacterium]